MPESHQITKRELLEMLQPFDDHDKIAIRAPMPKDGFDVSEEGEIQLHVNKVERVNEGRTALVINAYEA